MTDPELREWLEKNPECIKAYEEMYGRKPFHKLSKPYVNLYEDKRVRGWIFCWIYKDKKCVKKNQ